MEIFFGWTRDSAGEREASYWATAWPAGSVSVCLSGSLFYAIRRRQTEMRYIHGTAIKTFTSGDGKHSVDIVARHDGSYQYHEHTYVEADEFSGPHWEPRRMSGFYSSAELAERDALAELSWLRGQISN